MLLIGGGKSMLFTGLFRIVLTDVPGHLAGIGGGALITLQQTGLALGVATLGTLYLALHRHSVPHAFAAATGTQLLIILALGPGHPPAPPLHRPHGRDTRRRQLTVHPPRKPGTPMTTITATAETGPDIAAEQAAQLRVDAIRSSPALGSGHPTSSMSAADPLAVLVTRHLRDDRDNPRPPSDDHSIFSKHAFPLLCSVSKAVGAISEDELMGGYRRFGQWLQGHPTPVLAWVDLATGTLGQGLPDGAGIALPDRYLDLLPYRVWVLRGDSELAEGSIRKCWTRPPTTGCPTWSPSSMSTACASAARPPPAGTSTGTPAACGSSAPLPRQRDPSPSMRLLARGQ
jgi:Transketolase, thiamine diphosphate binding domain